MHNASAPRALPFDPYEPWRRTLLTPSEVRELSVLRPQRALADIAVSWLLIVGAWVIAARWDHWLALVLAAIVVGNRYYALFIIGHDGLHRRLMPSRAMNDAIADIFVFGPIGAVTRVNNQNHLRHHQHLASESDPDRHRHGCFNKSDITEVMFFLMGLSTVLKSARNVFFIPRLPAPAAPVPTPDGPRALKHSRRDLAILIGWQAALIVGLTLAFGWWGYPLLWLLPVFVFTFLADNFRSFAEHGHPESDRRADGHRLITYLSSPLEKALFAPMNMNYHAAHHLWISIPYYNLPLADSRMRSALDASGIEWRGSYLAFLWRYMRALPLEECRQRQATSA